MISRRQLLRGAAVASALGGTRRAEAEPPPEVTRIRIARTNSICQAPQYVAEALLKAEGFTELEYRTDRYGGVEAKALAAGESDLGLTFAAPLLLHIDAGAPILLLGGGHVGCLELFATKQIRAVSELKGKSVIVYARDSAPHVFLIMLLSHLGLNHRTDIELVTRQPREAMAMFAAGKADAFVASPPVAQELRAKQIGHVLVNSSVDRPWSQYFCCMIAANRTFVRNHPVAAKRAVRAILKSTDLCALEPARAARVLVDGGFTSDGGLALQSMKDVPYGRWRSYNPEDAVRFYALRLHEAGLIKANPKKIIADGTDWRILNELKKELKG